MYEIAYSRYFPMTSWHIEYQSDTQGQLQMQNISHLLNISHTEHISPMKMIYFNKINGIAHHKLFCNVINIWPIVLSNFHSKSQISILLAGQLKTSFVHKIWKLASVCLTKPD